MTARILPFASRAMPSACAGSALTDEAQTHAPDYFQLGCSIVSEHASTLPDFTTMTGRQQITWFHDKRHSVEHIEAALEARKRKLEDFR